MHLRIPITTGAAGVLLCLGGIGFAHAGSQALTQAQVTAKLKAAGYTNVHAVELEGRHFDADATKDGQPVHLHVDANTGAIRPVAHESEEEEKAEQHDRRDKS